MQTKNKNNLFISDELKDIVDLNSLTTEDTVSFFFLLEEKEFPVFSYVESKKKYKLALCLEENILQRLILKQIDDSFLCFNSNKIKQFKNQKDLIKIKVKKTFKNIYNVKLIFNKESKDGF